MLLVSDNNLFHMFQLVSLTIPDGKEIYTTYGDNVLWLSGTQREVDYLVPCSHEEADTRRGNFYVLIIRL